MFCEGNQLCQVGRDAFPYFEIILLVLCSRSAFICMCRTWIPMDANVVKPDTGHRDDDASS